MPNSRIYLLTTNPIAIDIPRGITFNRETSPAWVEVDTMTAIGKDVNQSRPMYFRTIDFEFCQIFKQYL